MCYYADNDGYLMTDGPQETPHGYEVKLQRQVASNEPYGKEYGYLLVTVTEVTKDTVRIKVAKYEML